jgi:hypothetical protein
LTTNDDDDDNGDDDDSAAAATTADDDDVEKRTKMAPTTGRGAMRTKTKGCGGVTLIIFSMSEF